MLSGALKRCVIVLKKQEITKKLLETDRDGQGESQVCVLDNDVNQRKMGALHCKQHGHWNILNICFICCFDREGKFGQLQNWDRRLWIK